MFFYTVNHLCKIFTIYEIQNVKNNSGVAKTVSGITLNNMRSLKR